MRWYITLRITNVSLNAQGWSLKWTPVDTQTPLARTQIWHCSLASQQHRNLNLCRQRQGHHNSHPASTLLNYSVLIVTVFPLWLCRWLQAGPNRFTNFLMQVFLNNTCSHLWSQIQSTYAGLFKYFVFKSEHMCEWIEFSNPRVTPSDFKKRLAITSL